MRARPASGSGARSPALVALAFAALGSTAGVADATGTATALTLSGLLAAPRSTRSVDARRTAIRFRAPADAELAEVELAWRRGGARCMLALHADEAGKPGARLASAPVRRARAWRGTPLPARLVGGRVYHLVVSCAPGEGARLAYVVDAERDPVEAGVWRLEDLRHGVRPRPAPASPRFALVFRDGRWWGQPYRASHASLRVCGRAEVRTSIVAVTPLTVAGVGVAAGRRESGTSIEYAIEAEDHAVLQAGTLFRAATRGAFIAATAALPLTLAPGASYVIRLRAPAGKHACVRLAGLASDVHLGPPVAGVQPLAVETSADAGRTWKARPVATLSSLVLLAHDDAMVTSTTTTTATSSTATTDGSVTTTSTFPRGAAAKTHASGYIARYDRRTIPLWPARLNLILGEADTEGPLLAEARRVAAAADNADVKFIFYISLTDLDSTCGCLDSDFYASFVGSHPEWILRDASGAQVSTHNGFGRVFTTDIGNPDYVHAWGEWVAAAIDRWGWDGVFADNIFRGNFSEWSATPMNPRTGAPYTTADYRRDMLAALRRLVSRFHAAGKILVGNHTSAYDASTFADQTIKDQVTTMDGVDMEDCVYDFNGRRHSEAVWISQLRYLDFANRSGVRTMCRGPAGSIGHPDERWYVLATHLLITAGESSVAELNDVDEWWDGLDYDLGAPRGSYVCLDPDAGLAEVASCPSAGKIYRRDWEHGRVLVNPTASRTVTVPLGEAMLWKGTPVRSVTLAPGSGAVLVRP